MCRCFANIAFLQPGTVRSLVQALKGFSRSEQSLGA
jgi:hypothetical protein